MCGSLGNANQLIQETFTVSNKVMLTAPNMCFFTDSSANLGHIFVRRFSDTLQDNAGHAETEGTVVGFTS